MDRIPTVLTTVGDPPVEIVINQRDYTPARYGPQRVLNPGQPDERVLGIAPIEDLAASPPPMAEVSPTTSQIESPAKEPVVPAVETPVLPSIPGAEPAVVRPPRHSPHRPQRPGKRR